MGGGVSGCVYGEAAEEPWVGMWQPAGWGQCSPFPGGHPRLAGHGLGVGPRLQHHDGLWRRGPQLLLQAAEAERAGLGVPAGNPPGVCIPRKQNKL